MSITPVQISYFARKVDACVHNSTMRYLLMHGFSYCVARKQRYACPSCRQKDPGLEIYTHPVMPPTRHLSQCAGRLRTHFAIATVIKIQEDSHENRHCQKWAAMWLSVSNRLTVRPPAALEPYRKALARQ